MKLLRILLIAGLLSGLGAGVLAMQRGGYGFGEEDEGPPLPVDIHEKAEWAFARFHFPSGGDFRGGFRGFRIWAADYPKADRQFVRGLRRLTRLNARAMEEVVDADRDALFDWPWIYMEHGGVWNLNEAQAARLRAYLLKGGFLLSDDTHGDYEWDGLMRGMHMIFPDRAVEELKDKDEILHVVYDLDNRFQIHGTRFIWGGRPYSPDMVTPKWDAIRDDKGRIMVAICHNSDVGDAWEWADSPRYPENETSLAYRIGINYILYDLTH
jgi:Domain of unknown function (DUF4159)